MIEGVCVWGGGLSGKNKSMWMDRDGDLGREEKEEAGGGGES